MILLDNIIFELQGFGGISKYWAKTIERADASDMDIAFLEGQGVTENAFRAELNLIHPVLHETGRPSFRPSRGSRRGSYGLRP